MPADVEFVDGVPFAAKSASGADLHEIRIKRSDPATGAPIWTRIHALTQLPDRVTAVELKGIPAGRLLARVSYRTATPGVQDRHAMLMIDRLTGDLIWQRDDALDLLGAPLVTGAADGSLYVNSTLCADPPLCTAANRRLERYSATHGGSLWMQPINVAPLAVRGVDLIGLSSDNQLSLLSAGNGAPFWSSVLTNPPYLPAALALANGDIAAVLDSRVGTVHKVDVERRAAGNGAPLWSTRPGLFDDKVYSGQLKDLPGGDLLLTARFNTPEPGQEYMSRPVLARIDPSTGALIWTHRGAPSFDLYHAVRAVPGGDAMRQWARSLRAFDGSNVRSEWRFALRSIALADGLPGPEHSTSETTTSRSRPPATAP